MGKRILVVDDSPMAVKFHSYLLRMLGLEVDHAENGFLALEKVLLRDYQLIITDINMPKMDGYEFIKEVRAQGQTMPIIVVSTEDQYRDRDQGLDAGANHYLVKPVEPQRFVQLIKELLVG